MQKRISLLAVFLAIIFLLTACGSDKESHEGEAKTPSASNVQKGRAYQDVVKDFEEKGFTNIQVEPIDDLITGWLTKDGEVEDVSVDGDVKYSSDRWYPNSVTVVIRYHTFPQKSNGDGNAETESTQSQEISQAEETSQAKEINLTIDNCEELKTLLAVKAEIDPLYSKFADTYEGATIEFDGCITYIANHDNYDTRYDILLSAGDYIDENTANPGPIFKIADVNTMNLGINDLFLPEFVSIGSNVRVVAKVLEFNSNTGLFFLEPILVTER